MTKYEVVQIGDKWAVKRTGNWWIFKDVRYCVSTFPSVTFRNPSFVMMHCLCSTRRQAEEVLNKILLIEKRHNDIVENMK